MLLSKQSWWTLKSTLLLLLNKHNIVTYKNSIKSSDSDKISINDSSSNSDNDSDNDNKTNSTIILYTQDD